MNDAIKKLDWIKAQLATGRKVYLATALVVTPVTAKAIDAGLVREKNGAPQVRRGKSWLDYSGAQLTAQ